MHVSTLARKTGYAVVTVAVAVSMNLTLLCPPAAALNASDQEYLEHIATALSEATAGSLASALQAVNAAMEHRRDEPIAYLARAIALLQGAAFAEAEKAFAEALKMGAEEDLCTYGSAMCRLGLGDLAGADRLLPKGNGRVPLEEVRLARVYVALLDKGHANVDGLTSDDNRRQYLRAYQLMRESKTAEAIALLRSVSESAGHVSSLDSGISMAFDRRSPLHTRLSAAEVSGAAKTSASPVSGYSGVVTLRADHGQTPTVGFVFFYVDEKLIGVVNSPPYDISWDTRRHANGVHTVRIRGEGVDGRLAGEVVQEVLVSNIAPEPGPPLVGPAADRVLEAAWQSMQLKGSKTWAEYQKGRAAESAGDRGEAMLCYERILASSPSYRDVRERWKSLAGFTASAPIWKGGGGESVALTFDDGPNGGTEELLAALSRLDATATFFIVGSQGRRNMDTLRRIAASGHEVAGHSETHRSMTQMSEQDLIRELFGPIAVIHEATGDVPRYFRPPGGHLDEKGRTVAAEFGLTPVMWSAHCGPYEGGSARTMEQYVASNMKGGSILLMHNCEPTTLSALPGILAGLQARNLKPVRLSDLLR